MSSLQYYSYRHNNKKILPMIINIIFTCAAFVASTQLTACPFKPKTQLPEALHKQIATIKKQLTMSTDLELHGCDAQEPGCTIISYPTKITRNGIAYHVRINTEWFKEQTSEAQEAILAQELLQIKDAYRIKKVLFVLLASLAPSYRYYLTQDMLDKIMLLLVSGVAASTYWVLRHLNDKAHRKAAEHIKQAKGFVEWYEHENELNALTTSRFKSGFNKVRSVAMWPVYKGLQLTGIPATTDDQINAMKIRAYDQWRNTK